MQLYARRLMGVLAVAGALLTTVAGPARAEDIHRGDPVSAGFPDIEVPVGGTAIDPLGPVLWSTGPTKLTEAKVSYDLSGVSGVRLVPNEASGGECVRKSPTRVVCTDPRELSFEGESIEQYLSVLVKADATAKVGDTGKVAITFSAKGLEPIAGTSEVRVIRGSGLPVTGPVAGLIGGIGLLLVGAGVGGVLAARRRRARFIA
ncbi:hypothetical protein ACIBSW_25875 [Actinoplanes sp. NPDC049668]|uniref:hypothetical protein n=1 Tax=unclassified Actinoplanes TaxID=2626549 RepID=UPI0033AE70B9